jgi:hypothetical protein
MSALGGKRTFASAFRAARWHEIAPGRASLRFRDGRARNAGILTSLVPIVPATQVASAANACAVSGCSLPAPI